MMRLMLLLLLIIVKNLIKKVKMMKMILMRPLSRGVPDTLTMIRKSNLPRLIKTTLNPVYLKHVPEQKTYDSIHLSKIYMITNYLYFIQKYEYYLLKLLENNLFKTVICF